MKGNKNIRVALICMVVGVVILITVIAIGSMGGRTVDVRVEPYDIPITPTLSDTQREAIRKAALAREIEDQSNANATYDDSNGGNPDVPTTTHSISMVGFSISMDVPALKVVCLNGVQYWADNDRDMRSESLAPKYSPGNRYPDICAE